MEKRLQIYDSDHPLSEILISMGINLDLRCGGAGVCGRCGVKLLSGQWAVNGVVVDSPVTACACRTWLRSSFGVVECDSDHSKISVLSQWDSPPLESSIEPVIGVDLGTTTIAAVKVCEGKVVAQQGMLNPQFIYGDNVIARLCGDVNKLSACIVSGVEKLIKQLEPDGVKHIGISGNTAMSCFFHGINPVALGRYPFIPPKLDFADRSDVFPDYILHTVPAISGFLGGDITSGLGEVDLQTGEMLVDLGTNCEIIFRGKKQYWGTSAASGPAFEGAGISCGVRAGDGAIIHYFGSNNMEVLGDGLPKGICGSALIDLLAVERKRGLLDENGRFLCGLERFEFAPGLMISETEISSLLLAKSAVVTGIACLEEVAEERAQTIYLAGAFAKYLNLANAIAIGLLPSGRNYKCVGNVSLSGAVRLALSPKRRRKHLLELSRLPKEFPLNSLPGFNEKFIASLSIP